MQTMLSAATSCLLMEAKSLHEYATDLTDQISDGTAQAAGSGHMASTSEWALTTVNQMLVSGRYDCYSWNGTTGNQSLQKTDLGFLY